MDSTFLKGFLLTVETGSMSEAARRLDVTPAAIAQQIKSLEKILETALVMRSGRTVKPTASGELLAQHAKPLIRGIEDLKSTINTNPLIGEFRLGSINTALLSFLPLMLKQFSETFPKAKISIKAAHSSELIRDVSNGDLDAAICLEPTFTLSKSLSWHELLNEPLILIKPLAVKTDNPRELIQTQTYIRYDRNLGGGKQAEQFLRKENLSPTEGFELSSLLSIALMVEAGLGVSIVPDIQSSLIDKLSIKKIKLNDNSPTRSIGILSQKHSVKKELIDHLIASYRKLPRPS